jgi:hypothetical protein
MASSKPSTRMPGPKTQRDLEILIGLEGFKFSEFGVTKHQ